MTRFFSLFLFVFGFTTFASAQSGTFNPKEPNNGNRGIVYDRETAFDLTLFGNGYEFGINIGKLKTYYRTEYFHIGLGELKHNREFKNRDGIGTTIVATSHRGDELQAEVELMFATLDDERFVGVELFEPAQFCRMIRLLRTFEVGVNPNGTPIDVPQHMVAAEKSLLHIG